MPAEQPKAIVRRFIEAVNERNLDVLDELYAADLACHRPPYPDIKDFEGYKQ